MKNILITGGSGFIGNHLTKLLEGKGNSVSWLTRKQNPKVKIKQYLWDYSKRKIEYDCFKNVDAVIHLSGASINGKRWDRKYKQEIYDSRVKSTEFLFESISSIPNKIKSFTSASATGYYPIAFSEKIFSETDLHGKYFLGQTCYDWEKAAIKHSELNIRTTIIRTGIVLTKDSEAFRKMSLPIRLGLGSAIGSGKQFFPWIHLDDLCEIYCKSISDESMYGIYNSVAPEYITNKQFVKAVANYYNKSLWLPRIPSFIIKIVFGELADSILLGNKISSEKIIASGFSFKYRTLETFLD